METATLNEFLLKYPGIFQSPRNESEFFGNMKIKNMRYRLCMTCPQFPSIRQMKLTVARGLSASSFDCSNFDPCWTISQVLDEIPNFLHNQSVQSKKPEVHYCTPNVCEVQDELIQLHSPLYEIYTDSQSNVIRFCNFKLYKDHYLKVERNIEDEFVVSDHSLPSGVDWQEHFRASSSIRGYLTQFLKFLDELHDFYANLADIDELCYVVQPFKHTTKDNWRIFKLMDRVFVKLVLDPLTCSPALINVFGPTYKVESLRHVLTEGLKNWDTDMDVHANLLRTFELTYFPLANEGAEQFCNICYCYQLDEDIPFISCDNRNCSLVYHAVCLKEWFTTLTDGKMFLEVAFGACPFCKEKLSTSFADLLK